MEYPDKFYQSKSGVIQMLLRSGFYIWAVGTSHCKPPFFPTLTTLRSLWWDIQSPVVPGSYHTWNHHSRTVPVPVYTRTLSRY